MGAVRLALLGLMLLCATLGLAPSEATHSPPSCANLVSHANWDFCWQLEPSRGQGLEITSAYYQHKLVFFRMGVPFSYTYYPGNGISYKDILGSASGTVPGYGLGAMTLTPDQCPRFLPSGSLVGGNTVCLEKDASGRDKRVAVWSRFNIYNYRFLQGYIFHADGTVEPKVLPGGTLAFCGGGTASSCAQHYHYLYWRMDVDLDFASNDRVQEFRVTTGSTTNQNSNSNCPHPSGAAWCTLTTEAARVRSLAQYTKWRVVDFGSLNSAGNPRSIELYSNSQGPSDARSTADVWALRYRGGTELGYQVPRNPASDAAITAYANGEAIAPADVVVWYAEKMHHEPRDEEKPTMMYHVAGPKLTMRNFVGSNNVENTYN